MRFLAVVEENERYEPGCRPVDERVSPASRRQHQGAIAGGEWFDRLAVEGDNPDVLVFQFDRNDIALAAIDEAEP